MTDRTLSATPVDTSSPVRADGDGCTGFPSLGDQIDGRSLTGTRTNNRLPIGKTWLLSATRSRVRNKLSLRTCRCCSVSGSRASGRV